MIYLNQLAFKMVQKLVLTMLIDFFVYFCGSKRSLLSKFLSKCFSWWYFLRLAGIYFCAERRGCFPRTLQPNWADCNESNVLCWTRCKIQLDICHCLLTGKLFQHAMRNNHGQIWTSLCQGFYINADDFGIDYDDFLLE